MSEFYETRIEITNIAKRSAETKNLEGVRTILSSCILDMLSVISRQLDVLIERGDPGDPLEGIGADE